MSTRTIKRTLHSFNFSWRRIRKKPKGEPDPVEYAEKKKELEELKKQAEQGCIDLYYLYYFDESGFSLEPYIPHAWQEKGETIQVESSKGKRLSVPGFLSLQRDLVAYTTGTVDSDVVIACLDAFVEELTGKTVLVMDNSTFHTSALTQRFFMDCCSLLQQCVSKLTHSIHKNPLCLSTSAAVEAKIAEWRSKNLEIFYLPKYSSLLNLIEILWRFIKYEWVEWWAYKGWSYLVKYVEMVICGYGSEYEINFVEYLIFGRRL